MDDERMKAISLHALKSFSTRPSNLQHHSRPWTFLLREDMIPSNDEHAVAHNSIFSPWKHDLLGQMRKMLNDHETWQTQTPLMITAYSGSGKTLFMTQVLAELLQAHVEKPGGTNTTDNNNDPDDERFPRFDVLFSQLKGSNPDVESLETAICLGLDDDVVCDSFDALERRRASFPSEHPPCIIIDSLDELQENVGKQWWKVSEQLIASGYCVIWSCRKTDFAASLINEDSVNTAFTEKYEEVKKWKWELDLRAKDIARIEEKADDLIQGKDLKKFLHRAYSEIPLLQMFTTNFVLDDGLIDRLNRELIEELVEKFRKGIENISGVYERENALNKNYFEAFFNIQPVKVLFDLTLNHLTTDNDQFKRPIKVICRETALDDESIQWQGTNAGLVNALCSFGLVVNSTSTNGKWRHRDFALQAHIRGKGGIKEVQFEREGDLPVMLRHIRLDLCFDNEGRWRSDIDVEQSKGYIRDFDRRTAGALRYSRPYAEDEPFEHDLLDYLRSLDTDLGSVREPSEESPTENGPLKQRKFLKKNQVEILKHFAGKTMVLRGFPGTGKTFTGIRRLLIRHAAQFRKQEPVRSLIVAYNDFLAKSIVDELDKEDYAELSEFTKAERERILSDIDVRSVKQIFQEWAPDLASKESPNWLFDAEQILPWFETWTSENKAFSSLSYTNAVEQVQRFLFSDRTGEPVPDLKEDDWIGLEEQERLSIEAWRKYVLDRLVESDMVAEEQIAAQLRLRLLAYEAALNASKPGANIAPKSYDAMREVLESERILNHLRRMFAATKYDMILIDEVQDISPLCTHMISFLAPHRGADGADRFVLAGDENQTINGRPFYWDAYLRRLTDLTERAVERAKEFGFFIGDENGSTDVEKLRPHNHHLAGLHWRDEARDSLLHQNTVLMKNYRNDEKILEFAKAGWDGWPKTTELERVREHPDWKESKDGGPSKMEHATQSGVAAEHPLRLFEATSPEVYDEGIKTLIEEIQSMPDTCLLVVSKALEDRIARLMDEVGTKVDFYNTWTIKGLEEDNVVLLGSYWVASNDQDTSKIIVNHRREFSQFDIFDEVQKRDFISQLQLFRRKHLVAHTRAKLRLICFYPPYSSTEAEAANVKHKQFRHTNDVQFEEDALKIDSVQRLKEEWKNAFSDVSVLVEKMYSMLTLQKGVKLHRRYGSDKERNLERFANRLEAQITKDRENSIEANESSLLMMWLDDRLGGAWKYISSQNRAILDLLNPLNEKSTFKPQKDNTNDRYNEVLRLLAHLIHRGLWHEEAFETFVQLIQNIDLISTKLGRGDHDELAERFAEQVLKNVPAGVDKDANREAILARLPGLIQTLDGQLLEAILSCLDMFGNEGSGGLREMEDRLADVSTNWSQDDFVFFVLTRLEKFDSGLSDPAKHSILLNIGEQVKRKAFSGQVKALNRLLGALAVEYSQRGARVSVATSRFPSATPHEPFIVSYLSEFIEADEGRLSLMSNHIEVDLLHPLMEMYSSLFTQLFGVEGTRVQDWMDAKHLHVLGTVVLESVLAAWLRNKQVKDARVTTTLQKEPFTTALEEILFSGAASRMTFRFQGEDAEDEIAAMWLDCLKPKRNTENAKRFLRTLGERDVSKLGLPARSTISSDTFGALTKLEGAPRLLLDFQHDALRFCFIDNLGNWNASVRRSTEGPLLHMLQSKMVVDDLLRGGGYGGTRHQRGLIKQLSATANVVASNINDIAKQYEESKEVNIPTTLIELYAQFHSCIEEARNNVRDRGHLAINENVQSIDPLGIAERFWTLDHDNPLKLESLERVHAEFVEELAAEILVIVRKLCNDDVDDFEIKNAELLNLVAMCRLLREFPKPPTKEAEPAKKGKAKPVSAEELERIRLDELERKRLEKLGRSKAGTGHRTEADDSLQIKTIEELKSECPVLSIHGLLGGSNPATVGFEQIQRSLRLLSALKRGYTQAGSVLNSPKWNLDFERRADGVPELMSELRCHLADLKLGGQGYTICELSRLISPRYADAQDSEDEAELLEGGVRRAVVFNDPLNKKDVRSRLVRLVERMDDRLNSAPLNQQETSSFDVWFAKIFFDVGHSNDRLFPEFEDVQIGTMCEVWLTSCQSPTPLRFTKTGPESISPDIDWGTSDVALYFEHQLGLQLQGKWMIDTQLFALETLANRINATE